MLYVNRAAGGLALILLLSLLVTSCQTAVFGRLAQAEPVWAHVVTGEFIAKKPDGEGRYRVRVFYCCITLSGPGDCYQTVRGISVPKHVSETYAGSAAAVPYAWMGAQLAATHACREPT